MNNEIKDLINEVTNQTVIKLKRSGLMKDNSKSAFKKTEEVLKNYEQYKAADSDKVNKFINIVDEALKTIEDDEYYEVITQFYFENKTREKIAEYFDCDVKTVTRNKSRLINKLKIILFSDKTIEELFL